MLRPVASGRLEKGHVRHQVGHSPFDYPHVNFVAAAKPDLDFSTVCRQRPCQIVVFKQAQVFFIGARTDDGPLQKHQRSRPRLPPGKHLFYKRFEYANHENPGPRRRSALVPSDHNNDWRVEKLYAIRPRYSREIARRQIVERVTNFTDIPDQLLVPHFAR